MYYWWGRTHLKEKLGLYRDDGHTTPHLTNSDHLHINRKCIIECIKHVLNLLSSCKYKGKKELELELSDKTSCFSYVFTCFRFKFHWLRSWAFIPSNGVVRLASVMKREIVYVDCDFVNFVVLFSLRNYHRKHYSNNYNHNCINNTNYFTVGVVLLLVKVTSVLCFFFESSGNYKIVEGREKKKKKERKGGGE